MGEKKVRRLAYLYCALLFCFVMLVFVCGKPKPTATPDNITTLNTTTDTITNSKSGGMQFSKVVKEIDLNIRALMGDTLVPMEISNAKNTDPYSKYSYNFFMNCYGCIGIYLHITDSVVSLSGVCGEDMVSSQTRKIEKIETNADGEIIIVVKGAKFIFRKMDGVAVYKLIVKGDFNLKGAYPEMVANYFNDLIEHYYTPGKELHKFVIHDCGDFQG